MPKISVIIPIYNVEQYLKECLESVINQTLKDIEIICINDGSTDSSPKILAEYAKRDNRIIIINQENSGVSRARNKGLDVASGEYVSFIDPDDYINTDFYNGLYNAAKINDADLCFCNCKKDFCDSTLEESYDFTNKNKNLEEWTTSTVWFFIYKRKFEIRFDTSIINGEDDLFSFLLFKQISSYNDSNKAIYYYRQRQTGASQNIKNREKSLSGRIKIIRTIIDFAKNNKKLFNRTSNSFYEVLIMELNTLCMYCPLNKNEIVQIYTLTKDLLFLPPIKEYRRHLSLLLLIFKITRKSLITMKISIKEIYLTIFNKELIRIGG